MKKFPEKYLNKYTLGDAWPILEKIPDNCVDLLFTSIPDVSQMDTETSEEEYEEFIRRVCSTAKRIVKDEGFVVFSQQDRRLDGFIIPKHVHFINEMTSSKGWRLKDEKIIIKDGIEKGSSLFQCTYQYMSIFTKKGKITRKGDFIRDVIVDEQKEFGGQKVWSIPFCQMVIESLTEPGAMVIDPFAGAGPVLYAAQTLTCNYWGAEIRKKRYNEDFKFFKQGLFNV